MKRLIQGFVIFGTLAYQGLSYGAIPPPPEERPSASSPWAESTWLTDAPIDAPKGRPTTDSTSSNTPSINWYNDMYRQLYDMQQHAQQVRDAQYSDEISHYADQLYNVLEKVYLETYDSSGYPRDYEWGWATRGDLNFYYYYWIRPLYQRTLAYGVVYTHQDYSDDHGTYSQYFTALADGYHKLTRCMFGLNGDDVKAEDDTQVNFLEIAAGIEIR